MFRAIALLCVALLPLAAHAEDKTIDYLQSISVTIRADGSQGSGVLFTREDNGVVRTFVHTAGHVIDGLRKTREVYVRGDRKTVVEYGDASVVSEFYEGGRRIGETTMDARVLRYSDAEHGDDLAILEVRKKNFVPLETSVEFVEDTPSLGTELYHVGSLLGGFGANSLTTGVVSKAGRVLDLGANGKAFTQVTCTAFPGSSGGGVFRQSDGKCIGLLVRGARNSEQFNFVVPVERMRLWAQKSRVEWAMDREVEMPDSLDDLPIEDVDSIKFNAEQDTEDVDFPFLLQRDERP